MNSPRQKFIEITQSYSRETTDRKYFGAKHRRRLLFLNFRPRNFYRSIQFRTGNLEIFGRMESAPLLWNSQAHFGARGWERGQDPSPPRLVISSIATPIFPFDSCRSENTIITAPFNVYCIFKKEITEIID